ncbi:hypothetical protein [Erwinia aphidicola]|uniref:hypothetical protein n=1 Tax=Erwinia aphidicola TaxID=68334 RepID=UPI003015B6F7
MEKVYELGQRLERLLYTSVIVIILSFIILSLSKSLAVSKSINTSIGYENIITSIQKKEEEIENIRKIENDYGNYKIAERKRKEEFEKKTSDEQRNKDRNLRTENIVREKLSLPPIVQGKIEFKEVPYENNDSQLSAINSLRKDVALPNIKNLDESNQGDRDIISQIIKKEMGYDGTSTRKLTDFLTKNNYDLGKFVSYLKNEVSKSKTENIKILDIDTPVDFPLSIGSMKLNIPMSNIENWALKTVPIFLVIWIGAIFITRSFEITQLLESKKIMSFYPHILNVYNIKSKNQSSANVTDTVVKAMAGQVKEIKTLQLESILLTVFRVTILTVMLLSMTIPVYFGFFIYLKSDSDNGFVMYLTSIIIPALINFIQIISCIRFETMTSTKTFIIDGEENEML